MAITKVRDSQSLHDIFFVRVKCWGGGEGREMHIEVIFAKNNDINTKFKMSAPNLHIPRQIIAFW